MVKRLLDSVGTMLMSQDKPSAKEKMAHHDEASLLEYWKVGHIEQFRPSLPFELRSPAMMAIQKAHTLWTSLLQSL
eukprot:867008-Amphidinium_carterae.1